MVEENRNNQELHVKEYFEYPDANIKVELNGDLDESYEYSFEIFNEYDKNKIVTNPDFPYEYRDLVLDINEIIEGKNLSYYTLLNKYIKFKICTFIAKWLLNVKNVILSLEILEEVDDNEETEEIQEN